MATLCACGCGQTLSKPNYTYAQGHEAPGSRKRMNKRPFCLCGCNQRVTRAGYEYRAGHRYTLRERMEQKTRRFDAGCWEWIGSHVPMGYGTMWVPAKGKKSYVHRLSWEMSYGDIPEGMSVLHRCDNPPCWNPEHLFLGTHQDNAMDMVAKGRGRNQYTKSSGG